MNCRHCYTQLEQTFLDLGHAPPSNAYLAPEEISAPESYFPLKLKVCTECWLVQTEDYTKAYELFDKNYAYFSSTSTSWLEHASKYCNMIREKLNLDCSSLVIEIASNDGYLLKNFLSSGIPCLGIEPTASTAAAAEAMGIQVMREFFGLNLAQKLASEGKLADLILGNNVFAHVPDINDFTAGMKAALKPHGTITLEFPHLMRLIEQSQFDTVYHEHFSYLSLYTVKHIFANAGLRIWDVEELPTHGGSLRIYGCHSDDHRPATKAADDLIQREEMLGLRTVAIYQSFQQHANKVKDDLLMFLIEQKRAGKNVAAYGAAAKGNTLLNYAGVKQDLLTFVCDAAPSKQGKFLPGSLIPIFSPAALKEHKPDVILILPWNIANEILEQHGYVREWEARFAVAVPEIRFLN